MTLGLIEQGVNEGVFRDVDYRVFQLAFEAAVERFLMGDELDSAGIPYMTALNELVNIMVDGVVKR